MSHPKLLKMYMSSEVHMAGSVNRPIRRKTGSVLAVALVLTSGAACTSERVISAYEGRDRAVQLTVDSIAELDVTGWKARNVGPWAQSCTLKGETSGAQYGFDLWAPRGEEPMRDAKLVAAYWKSLGMEVRIIDQGGPVVYGKGGPVLRADFDTHAADNSYSLGATAPCALGSPIELNAQDMDALKRGQEVPGWEYLPHQEDSGE